ncbi:MAG: transcriptional repressor LexA, partial [Atopobiaceae bacterium]|nr:transcriptional repressor LexA [Atopobiaceae bacterium]
MAKTGLSNRQKQIYDYICTYTKAHGFPPSVREIGRAVGLASPSTVHMHL